jgi:hypothetical protein
VAQSQRLRRRQVEDERVNAMGCVGPCYPTFAVFNVLGPRGIDSDGENVDRLGVWAQSGC